MDVCTAGLRVVCGALPVDQTVAAHRTLSTPRSRGATALSNPVGPTTRRGEESRGRAFGRTRGSLR